MWRHKTDRRLIAAGLFILALIIGFNAWKDMQPKTFTPQTATLTAYTLVSRAEDVDAVKKDETASGIFWAGDIAGDPPQVDLSPVPPVSLGQQASMPLFRMDAMPKNLSALFDALAPAVKPWAGHNSTMNDIYIDYQSTSPDLDALSALTNGLRGYFEQQYWIVAGLRRTPLSYPQETRIKLGNMLKSVEYFVYYVDDVVGKDETVSQAIMRLEKEGVPFMLRTSRQLDYAALMAEIADSQQYFAGFIVEAAQTEPQEKSK